MKKALVLIAVFLLGYSTFSQNEKRENFSLSLVENVLPFADVSYDYDTWDSPMRYGCGLQFLNYLPQIELGYDNRLFARLRFNVLHADEGGGEFDSNIDYVQPPYKQNYFNHDIATSTSVTLGYNFLPNSKAFRLKASLILGAVYVYKDYYYGKEYSEGYSQPPTIYTVPTERSLHFQAGAELAFQYFLPATDYRLGFGASCELSYAKGFNAQPTIETFNLNISYKIFNF